LGGKARRAKRIDRFPHAVSRHEISCGSRFSNLHIHIRVCNVCGKDDPTRDRDAPGGKPSYGSAIPSSMSSHKPTCYRSPGAGIYEQVLLCLRQESSSIPLGGRAVDKQRRQRSTLGVKIKIVIRGISLSLSLSLSLSRSLSLSLSLFFSSRLRRVCRADNEI